MVMKKWETIQQVKKVKEESAAGMLAKARGELAAQNDKLNQLNDYLAEYLARHSSNMRTVTVQQLKGLSGFCDQLKVAIKAQQIEIHKHEDSVNKHYNLWLTAYQEHESIKMIIEQEVAKLSMEEAQKLRRKEDELVNTAYSYRHEESERFH